MLTIPELVRKDRIDWDKKKIDTSKADPDKGIIGVAKQDIDKGEYIGTTMISIPEFLQLITNRKEPE